MISIHDMNGKVLVNLHMVVRQGLRAGVPSYSLKEVEALAGFARRADMRTGTDAVLALSGTWTRAMARCWTASPPTTTRTAGRRWRCVTGWSPTGRTARAGLS